MSDDLTQSREYTKGTKMTDATETLYLKWGTLKGWDNAGPKLMEALKAYHAHGVAAGGVMMQRDTAAQKEALCACIDAVDGVIWHEWDGRAMTKDEAKAYVRTYRTP